MPTSESEAREALAKRFKDSGTPIQAVADRLGTSYLWVWRRLNGKTSMKVDDYNAIFEALDQVK